MNLQPRLEDARYGQHAVAVETGPDDGSGVVLGLVSAENISWRTLLSPDEARRVAEALMFVADCDEGLDPADAE